MTIGVWGFLGLLTSILILEVRKSGRLNKYGTTSAGTRYVNKFANAIIIFYYGFSGC